MALSVEPPQLPPATVSPSDVYGTTDSFSEDFSELDDTKNLAFLLLEFPDVSWAMRQPSVIIGRDEKLQRYLEDTQCLRVTKGGYAQMRDPNGQRSSASASSEDSPDQSDFEDDFPGGTEFKYSPDGGCRTHLPLEYTDAKRDKRNEQFLAVHPPVDEDTGELPALTKISKQHLRLDIKDSAVVMTVLGRNGLFLNEDYYAQDDQERVRDGDRVRIGGLDIYLRFNPLNLAEGAEDEYDGSSNESNEEDVNLSSDTPASSVERGMVSGHKDGKRAKERIQETTEGGDETRAKVSRTIKLSELQKRDHAESKDQLKARLENLTGGQIQPRKGPGRPPANGLMSKRQMRELAKTAKQSAPSVSEGHGASNSKSRPERRAAGDDAVHDATTSAKDRNKKRKRSDTGADAKESKNVDRKRKEESPRSPSPTEDQYTSEQLEHPGLTYVVMIHKILKDCEPTQLNLQQMYKEVKKRWPYYRFRKESSGWESSVRHTIKSNFFKQGERDGKGFKYTINPDQEPPPPKQRPPPAPAPPQPVPYTNGQYPRGPPLGPPFNGANYRPGFSNGPLFPPYQMQNQRPYPNGPGQVMHHSGAHDARQNLQLRDQGPPMQNGRIAQMGDQPGFQPMPHANGQAHLPVNIQSTNPQNPTTTQSQQPQNHQALQTNKGAPVQTENDRALTRLYTSSGQAHTQAPAQADATNTNASPTQAQNPTPVPARPPSTTSGPPPPQSQAKHTSLPIATDMNGSSSNTGNNAAHTNGAFHTNQASLTIGTSHPDIPFYTSGASTPSTQMLSQPSPVPISRPGSTNVSGPITTAITSHGPLPSEEVRQGRMPSIITRWHEKLLEEQLGMDLPQHVRDDQNSQIEAAIDWFMNNPNIDPAEAPEGSTKVLVGLIHDLIRDIDRLEIHRRTALNLQNPHKG